MADEGSDDGDGDHRGRELEPVVLRIEAKPRSITRRRDETSKRARRAAAWCQPRPTRRRHRRRTGHGKRCYGRLHFERTGYLDR